MGLQTLDPACSVEDMVAALDRDGAYTDPRKVGGDSDVLPPEMALGRRPRERPVLIKTDATEEAA
jgi:hypothetical protein